MGDGAFAANRLQLSLDEFPPRPTQSGITIHERTPPSERWRSCRVPQLVVTIPEASRTGSSSPALVQGVGWEIDVGAVSAECVCTTSRT